MEQSLKEALFYLSITELPPRQLQEDLSKFWIEAIALVQKRDGTKSYTLAKRSSFGRIRHIKDFGTSSQIVNLLAVHPIKTIDTRIIAAEPSIKKQCLEQLIYNYGDAPIDTNTLTEEQINEALMDYIYRDAIKREESENKANEVMQAINTSVAKAEKYRKKK